LNTGKEAIMTRDTFFGSHQRLNLLLSGLPVAINIMKERGEHEGK